MEDQDVYKNDTFGLRTLNEAGKIQKAEIVGNHLQFTDEDVSKIFVPFLVNGVQPKANLWSIFVNLKIF